MKALLLFLVLTPLVAVAEETPWQTRPDLRGRPTHECLSVNRSGQRFIGRQIGVQAALDEALYQCFVNSNEVAVKSCRVEACRVRGGAWKRMFQGR